MPYPGRTHLELVSPTVGGLQNGHSQLALILLGLHMVQGHEGGGCLLVVVCIKRLCRHQIT